MSLESGLLSYLGTNVPTLRLYPLHLPQSATYPCASYGLVSRDHLHNLTGAAGIASARMQIDFWSTVFAETLSLAESVRVVLDGFRGSLGGVAVVETLLDNEIGLYEQPADASDLGLYHLAVFYVIRYRETVPTF